MDTEGHKKPSTMEGNQSVTNLTLNALDVNRLFKGKTDKGKGKQIQSKKPPPGKTQSSNQSRSGQLGRQVQR